MADLEKIEALSVFVYGEDDIDIAQKLVTEIDEGRYEADDEDYLVLTEEEADEKALQYAKDLIDVAGYEGLNLDITNYIDEERAYRDAFEEMNRSYMEEIQTEESSDDSLYLNRLHEELVEAGLCEDLESNPDIDEDSLVDDYEYEFSESTLEGYDGLYDYFENNFGKEEAIDLAKKSYAIDDDEIAEDIVNIDGRGSLLSSWDGNEYEENGYFIYKLG